MLREDTLKTIHSAFTKGVPVTPTPEALHAIGLQAKRLRAIAMQDAFRSVFGWLWRGRDDSLPAGTVNGVHSR